MNLPNKITTLRILLTGVVLIFASFFNFYSILIAMTLGIIICLLDILDGYLARKYKLITDFGRIIDPIADKIFSVMVFIYFVSVGMMPFSIVAIILAREIAVSGIRILGARIDKIIEADLFGKIKSFFQYITLLIFALALLHHLYVKDFHATGIVNEQFVKAFILNPMLYLALTFTVLSFVNYIYKNRHLFKDL